MKPPRQESTHKKNEKNHSSAESNITYDRTSMVPALAKKRSKETKTQARETKMTNTGFSNINQQNETDVEKDKKKIEFHGTTTGYFALSEVFGSFEKLI